MRRAAIVLALLLVAPAAHARIGGGDSYSDSSSSYSSDSSSYSDSGSDYSSSSDSGYSSSSGSSSSSRGGSGGSADAGAVVLVFFAFLFIGGVIQAADRASTRPIIVTVAPARAAAVNMAALRDHDPNFSEIVFTDFCYSLFAKLYEARGQGRLDQLAPYVDASVREGLAQHTPPGLVSVDGIVIGGFTVTGFHGLEGPRVHANVEFEANFTEVTGAGPRRFYLREVWTLTRMRDLLSPPPEKARAAHCPKCGAALGTRADGACLHCGTVINDGTFNWFLTDIRVIRKDEQPPRIGGSAGPEPGLDRPTVMQPWIGRHCKTFVEKHPGFTWDDFYKRVHHVAVMLQNAWSSRDWHRARPYETDALFQTHRYWIEEYQRQGLRNLVDGYAVDQIEVAKVTTDAFYDAITVRLFASGNDYTVNESGAVVGGSQHLRKLWSEYWTFIRGRAGAPAGARNCPNCGGALAEGQTAVCAYCGGKVTAGEFPWVLSRIEQDEAYRG